jgi:hypothetical protein
MIVSYLKKIKENMREKRKLEQERIQQYYQNINDKLASGELTRTEHPILGYHLDFAIDCTFGNPDFTIKAHLKNDTFYNEICEKNSLSEVMLLTYSGESWEIELPILVDKSKAPYISYIEYDGEMINPILYIPNINYV